MVKVMYSCKTSHAFSFAPWHFSTGYGARAFRGWGAHYHSLLSVDQFYSPAFDNDPTEDGSVQVATDEQPSYLIHSGRTLARSVPEKDEKVMLITLGGSDEGYSRVEVWLGDVLLMSGAGYLGGRGSTHLIVRLLGDEGFVYAETYGTGLVEIFSWKDGYRTMPTEEFEVWFAKVTGQA